MKALLWIAAAALTAAGTAQAASASVTCSAESPKHTVALVELFTSEGCPYCPAADRWLRELPAAGLGRDRVVPIALHVDYWDDKGWTDRFAQARFTERQRAYKTVAGARAMYTPQVLLAGRDTRSWREADRFAEDVRAVSGKPARAAISVVIESIEAGAAEVRVRARASVRADAAGAVLYVAAYENGLVSRVSAGDNNGLTLGHDYVVREWIGPLPLGSPAGERVTAMTGKFAAAGRGGIAAFVQLPRTGEVLQAVALPYCDRKR